MQKDNTAIVLIAYGSCLASGLAALRTFENRVRQRYPGIPVRWAYTSGPIRARLASHVRRKSDSVVKAIQRLALERFSPIIAQPLQIIMATENESVEAVTRTVSDKLGIPLSMGQPLLSSDEDVCRTAKAVMTHLPSARLATEDVILVGHGAKAHVSQKRYAQLAEAVHALDAGVHIATLSGDMRAEKLLPVLSSEKVWLMPLLASIGKHTVSDIAGTGDTSVRSLLEQAGHCCTVVKSGVLENAAFADIWLSHLDEAAARFNLVPSTEKHTGCAV